MPQQKTMFTKGITFRVVSVINDAWTLANSSEQA